MIHNGISPFPLVHGTLRPLDIVPHGPISSTLKI